MTSKRTQLERTALLEEFVPEVRRCAASIASNFLGIIEKDDLFQVGLIGLMEAIDRYEEKDGSREGYFMLRARGAMYDEIRSQDHVPRTLRALKKEFGIKKRELEHRLGSKPTDGQIAVELGITIDQYHKALATFEHAKVMSIDAFEEDQNGSSLLDSYINSVKADQESFIDSEVRERIIATVNKLPRRLAFVTRLYYEQSMTLKEISGIMGLNESRVNQLQIEALESMRSILN